MAGVIVLSSIEAATNPDILQGTRLQTVPQGGILTFEIQASAANDTDAALVSIQLPSGETPLEGVMVPATPTGTAGVIDERTDLMASFPVAQGGHTVFSLAFLGAGANVAWRVTYTPA